MKVGAGEILANLVRSETKQPQRIFSGRVRLSL